MTVALGAAVSSCEKDQSMSEIEKVVLEYEIKNSTDDDERVGPIPGTK